MVRHGHPYELIQCLLKLVGLLIKIDPFVGILDRLTFLLLVELVTQMIPPALSLCEIFPLIESKWSSLVVALESMEILSSHVVDLVGCIVLNHA